MKILKWILGIILILAIGLFILVKIASEPMPQGTQGPAADALANKVLAAIDKPAWDTTGAVQWSFRNNNYLWDKQRNLVKVSWEDNEVLVVLNETTGKAWKNGVELTGDKADKLVKAAWSSFCNDSFWLNAPAKVFDPGTKRSIVDLPNGNQGLLISYESGGTTPGDAYLWILDNQGLPTSYKMWVKIIPIGGTEASWEDYKTVATGAKLSTKHKLKILGAELDIPIANIKAGTNLNALGLADDPFKPIL